MITFTVRVKGDLKGDAAKLRSAARRFSSIVDRAMTDFGNEAIEHLYGMVAQRTLNLPPKDDGSTPLIETGRYIRSYRLLPGDKPLQYVITPTGDNEHMPNRDLAELLEYGWKYHPPMPHLRPLGVWMTRQFPRVGDGIVRELRKELK